jgi:hypothetical protein
VWKANTKSLTLVEILREVVGDIYFEGNLETTVLMCKALKFNSPFEITQTRGFLQKLIVTQLVKEVSWKPKVCYQLVITVNQMDPFQMFSPNLIKKNFITITLSMPM